MVCVCVCVTSSGMGTRSYDVSYDAHNTFWSIMSVKCSPCLSASPRPQLSGAPAPLSPVSRSRTDAEVTRRLISLSFSLPGAARWAVCVCYHLPLASYLGGEYFRISPRRETYHLSCRDRASTPAETAPSKL